MDFDLHFFMSLEGESLGVLSRGAMVKHFNKLDERSIEKERKLFFYYSYILRNLHEEHRESKMCPDLKNICNWTLDLLKSNSHPKNKLKGRRIVQPL